MLTDNEALFFVQYLEFVYHGAARQPMDKVVELAARDRLTRGLWEYRKLRQ
jgi:hypothetical protein